MFVYIVLFLICFGSSILYDTKIEKKDKRTRRVFFGIIFLSCSLVQALRYDVGSDYLGTYTNLYNMIYYYPSKEVGIETAFLILYKTLIFFKLGLPWFFVITSFVINFLFIKTIFDYNEKISLSIFMYFFGTLYFFSMTAIRQSISIGLFFISLKYIEEKNPKKYMLINLIGCLFHTTSIIFIPLYFLFNIKLTNKILIISVGLMVIVVPIIMPYIQKILMLTKYAKYYTVDSTEIAVGKLNLSAILNIILYGFFVIFANKKRLEDTRMNIYCNITLCGIMVSFLGIYLPAGYRLFSAFKYTEILSVPYFLKITNYSKNKNSFSTTNLVLRCLLISMYMFYFGYSILYKNYNDCLPYKFIFEYL